MGAVLNLTVALIRILNFVKLILHLVCALSLKLRLDMLSDELSCLETCLLNIDGFYFTEYKK